MSRHSTGGLALLMFACVAPFGLAQSPELPRSVLLTVQPITYLPVDWMPRPGTPPAEEVDRLEKTRRGPVVSGLLEVLDTLGEVPQVAPARRKATRLVAELLEQTEFVRSLFAHGSFKAELSVDEDGRYQLVLAFHKKASWKELVSLYATGLRAWMSYLHTEAGKKQVAQMYLQAAHKALDDGQTTKAADLVKQAHAWKPALVEADPMAFKLHLLDMGKPGPSGEEAAEPGRLPIHPRQYSSEVMKLRAWSTRMLQSQQVEQALALARAGLDGAAVPMTSPVDYQNGVVLMGFSPTRFRPTLTMFVRCPESHGNWVVHLGNGMLPIVWMMPER